MRHIINTIVAMLLMAALKAQVEPSAGKWKTWIISSGNEHGLKAPGNLVSEIEQVIASQRKLDSSGLAQMHFWNAGSPGYRWQAIMDRLWTVDTASTGILANLLLGVSIYDATIAAWDAKYRFNLKRPFELDKRVRLMVVDPRNPSYPCEHSVAAGAASTIIGHFYPKLADSMKKLAQQVMNSRIAAGVAFPSGTRAGFDLGKMVAEKAIAHTKDFVVRAPWDGTKPQGAGLWQGKPMFPNAGKNKPFLLEKASQFRPGPPPDFAKEMEELKNFKPTFRSTANAFHFASSSDDVIGKKIFEYNLHLNAPRAARIYAYSAIAAYDGFISCWDAKYTYWGIRPDQYDTTFRPVLFFTPPFPGYPSGHAMVGAVSAEILSYFFPADRPYFDKRARDGAESRFQGGIHFRSDNEVGLTTGRQVGKYIVDKIKNDGVDDSGNRQASIGNRE